MPEYDNRNRGVLFKNDRKETDKHPDYTGRITLEDRTERYLSAWINTSKTGRKYLSVTIGKEIEKTDDTHEKANKPAPDFDDDIPF